jgi:undecaprenyl-diphosphatase
VFFWRDWVRILRGFGSSLRYRRVETADERLAWMIVIATIPVGITGLLLEHTFRTVLGKPIPAAIFLTLNGLLLYGAELLRRRAATPAPATDTGAPVPVGAGHLAGGAAFEPAPDVPGPIDGTEGPDGDRAADARIVSKGFVQTTLIGAAQILALLPGISRSGATMAAGLARGLSHEDAARFSFLLATPVILAAGVLKLPDLTGSLGAGIHGQVLAGSLASGIAAYLAVRFLTRWFHTRTLTPFAIYCTVAGLASLLWLTVG